MEFIKNEKPLKASDLENLKQEVVNEVMTVVQREIIAILAQAVATRSEIARVEESRSDTRLNGTDDNTDETVNPIVADMASLWGADEEE